MAVRIPDRLEEEKEKRRIRRQKYDADFTKRVCDYVKAQARLHREKKWKLPQALKELEGMVLFREKVVKEIQTIDGKSAIGTGNMIPLRQFVAEPKPELTDADLRRGQMKLAEWEGVEQSG